MAIRYLLWLGISSNKTKIGRTAQLEFVNYLENIFDWRDGLDVNSESEYIVHEDGVYSEIGLRIQTKEFPSSIISKTLEINKHRCLSCEVTICDIARGTAVSKLHPLSEGNRYIDIVRGHITSAFETILPSTGPVIDLSDKKIIAVRSIDREKFASINAEYLESITPWTPLDENQEFIYKYAAWFGEFFMKLHTFITDYNAVVGSYLLPSPNAIFSR